MGLLDDAIREHLELKRRRGADADEIARLEAAALGDPRSGEFAKPDEERPAPAASEPEPEPEEAPWLDDERIEPAGQPTAEFVPPDVEPEPEVVRPDDEPGPDEDVLEETP